MSGKRILVTGSTGRLGRAVLARLGDRGCAGVRRRENNDDAVLIDSDGTVDPIALEGFAAIVNCAGRVAGSAQELTQANVNYPTQLAKAAKSAGVSRFVQVSSFSVFGGVEWIGRDTPAAPVDDYGRSKLAAETALRELESDAFQVQALRLPFMFSVDHPAHLGRLVTIIRRLRVLPTLSGPPVARSMITYDGAAAALIESATAEMPHASPCAAADPEPLALVSVAREVQARLGTRVLIFPLPHAIARFAHVAPGVGDRLFRSSILAMEANALTRSAPAGVHAEMRAYLDLIATKSAGQRAGN